MIIRTDLAIENKEYIEKELLDGVLCEEETIDNLKITRIKIINQKGAKILDKPIGKYVSIEYKNIKDIKSSSIKILKSEIEAFLPQNGLVLIAGLGNERITADSLGPVCTDRIISARHTRHNDNKCPLSLSFRFVCVKTDVFAKTGIEASETILGLVKTINPQALIIIDSLASRNYKRLGCVIQVSDSGIVPGSGVNNHRREISKSTLNIPVISIGVPTVIDGSALYKNADFIENHELRNVFITCKNIDFIIENASKLISCTLNTIFKDKINITDL